MLDTQVACDFGAPRHSLWFMLEGDFDMKRDSDLLRQVMFEIEAHDDWLYLCALSSSSSPDDRQHYYHLRLLADAGFLEETGKTGGVFRMTNDGHDFLALTRPDERWQTTKAAASAIKDVSLAVLKDIATGVVRQQLTGMGIPLG